MRYHIAAIGKLKRTFFAEGCAFYIKRLRAYAPLELSELKEAKTKEAESSALLGAVRKSKPYLIGLDETGKTFSSAQLANHLSRLEGRGISTVGLLIGGASGHSDSLKREVDELWRLSSLTLPHDLARLVLLEQLYRAETIRAGHPYHKD